MCSYLQRNVEIKSRKTRRCSRRVFGIEHKIDDSHSSCDIHGTLSRRVCRAPQDKEQIQFRTRTNNTQCCTYLYFTQAEQSIHTRVPSEPRRIVLLCALLRNANQLHTKSQESSSPIDLINTPSGVPKFTSIPFFIPDASIYLSN